MARVGDLLELLHDADSRLATFSGEFRDWAHPAPSDVLLVSSLEIPEQRIRWRGAGPWPGSSERRRRIWFEQPDRARVEVSRNGYTERIVVRHGNNWWRWDSASGSDGGPVITTDGVWMLPPLLDMPLFSPARLIGWLRLEPAGAGIWRDHKVVLARGSPRNAPIERDDLSFELAFHARYGTVLRHAAFEHGRCVRLTEAMEVWFNPVVDPDRFVLRTPDPTCQEVRA